jgi:hypothetical protein
MIDVISGGEAALDYVPKFREYGIKVLDGGSSYILISFCPWCGRKLPGRLRDAWFDEVERLGMNMDHPALPLELLSDEWWRKRHL